MLDVHRIQGLKLGIRVAPYSRWQRMGGIELKTSDEKQGIWNFREPLGKEWGYIINLSTFLLGLPCTFTKQHMLYFVDKRHPLVAFVLTPNPYRIALNQRLLQRKKLKKLPPNWPQDIIQSSLPTMLSSIPILDMGKILEMAFQSSPSIKNTSPQ